MANNYDEITFLLALSSSASCPLIVAVRRKPSGELALAKTGRLAPLRYFSKTQPVICAVFTACHMGSIFKVQSLRGGRVKETRVRGPFTLKFMFIIGWYLSHVPSPTAIMSR